MSKIPRFQNEINHNVVSRYPREPWNMPHHLSQASQQQLNSKGRGRNFQMPSLASGILSGGDVDTQHGPLTAMSRMGSSTIDANNCEARSVASIGLRPPVNVHNSRMVPLHSNFPMQNHRSEYDLMNSSNPVKNTGPNKSFYIPGKQLDSYESKELSSTKLSQLPNQNTGLIPIMKQNQVQTPLQPRFLQNTRDNFLSSTATPVPPHVVTPSLDRGYTMQGYNATISTVLSNPVPLGQLSLPTNNSATSSLHLQGGGLPPKPPGPPPPSQATLPSHNAGPAVSSQQPGSAFSGLISSLMAQGLISLTKPSPQVSEQFTFLLFKFGFFIFVCNMGLYLNHVI